jgi:L-2-hydroxyglutarate oxidase LhgO
MLSSLVRQGRAGGIDCGSLPRAGARKRVGIQDANSGKTYTVFADHVVNAAGLHAQEVAHSLGVPHASVPERFLAKGNYFSLEGEPRCARKVESCFTRRFHIRILYAYCGG